jgi:TonB family protein
MPIVIRSNRTRLRSAMSFAVSACVHGSVLALVIFGGRSPAVKPRSLYDQEIRPFEKKIVWYRLSDRLPEIAPEAAERRPLRARIKSPQTLVAGARDDATPAPMIYAPEPPEPTPKPVELPNVIAIAPPKPVRPFVAPPDVRRDPAAPALSEPPRVEAKLDVQPLSIDLKGPKPAPRAFVPPPVARMARQASLMLPEAPEARQMVIEANALALPAPSLRPRPRDFVPPSAKLVESAPVALPAAPEVSGPRGEIHAALPRTFVPPPNRPVDRSAPAVGEEGPAIRAAITPTAETTMAIVGLNPANTRELPAPPASRPAGFSAGPVMRKDGSSASDDNAGMLNVPGLTARGGAKDTVPTLQGIFSATSKENLMAAARLTGIGSAMKNPPDPRAARVSEAPDPRLAGRVIYTVAIQMPNVTSFSGSWLVWFAEREPLPGSPAVDMRAPSPLRKVDPKYVAAAVAERVEGSVRLAGVIRKDGRVDGIALVKHLDDRLDRTAQEALAKWEFTPATRNGNAVDVDAVFEIPFHLAPRSTK